jgi:hypothetical protein
MKLKIKVWIFKYIDISKLISIMYVNKVNVYKIDKFRRGGVIE